MTPDLRLMEAKKVADHADMYYIPVVPHNIASPVETAASAHVCAAMQNFPVIECHGFDVPWWSGPVTGDPVIKAGLLVLR